MSKTRCSSRIRPGIQGAALAFGVVGVLVYASAPRAMAQQASRDAAPAVTFAKDVAPILQKNCQECHRPGSIGPMSLQDLRGSAPLGPIDQAEGGRRARCRPTVTTRSASST